MRNQWYADNRDLVKWSVLVRLAERYAAQHILQVLYYRPTDWAQLDLDGQQVALPESVVRHFRQASAVSTIDAPAPIEVVTDTFADRGEYHRIVLDRIRSRIRSPGIVFLDPDTGLEPRAPSLEHVLNSELTELWKELQAGDLLVFYQHQTNRNGQPWVGPKREQFELALGIPAGAAKVAWAEKIARDVAFFYAQKSGKRMEPTRPSSRAIMSQSRA
jgi:hypothetical protein